MWKKEGARYHHAVRKAKARCDRTKAEKLLVAALHGDSALLKEMKIIRRGGGGPAEVPDTVAGGNGEKEIVENFKLVYSGLYNSASTNEKMQVLQDTVERLSLNQEPGWYLVPWLSSLHRKSSFLPSPPPSSRSESVFSSWRFSLLHHLPGSSVFHAY